MKETILEKNNHLPYSLHDMRVNEIQINENDIIFIFENGYIKMEEPYAQVEGTIIIKNVDYDFCSVHLLSRNGYYGRFNGKKLDIKEFVREFRQYSFEIVDELYGFNQVQYSGYLSLPNKEDVIACSMDFYYIGDLIYITKE